MTRVPRSSPTPLFQRLFQQLVAALAGCCFRHSMRRRNCPVVGWWCICDYSVGSTNTASNLHLPSIVLHNLSCVTHCFLLAWRAPFDLCVWQKTVWICTLTIWLMWTHGSLVSRQRSLVCSTKKHAWLSPRAAFIGLKVSGLNSCHLKGLPCVRWKQDCSQSWRHSAVQCVVVDFS